MRLLRKLTVKLLCLVNKEKHLKFKKKYVTEEFVIVACTKLTKETNSFLSIRMSRSDQEVPHLSRNSQRKEKESNCICT
jgi:hypothetical protein